ncbi:lytic murein transglycosylase [Crenothrix polyspora]|uniref:Membrane-bound lytic murein transglycosylase B n=1 Tax=Crenothrix polyspora TaxID=360316 RepID=A0A1R4H6U1_9GAMM|nr:lytic murein transglycosylase [Crenothrix polyspora]SJM91909.1 Membrane-bound lytic murein transglycosylase B [Crenothrix polyspora]
MTTTVYKHFLTLALTVLLAGCASDDPADYNSYPSQVYNNQPAPKNPYLQIKPNPVPRSSYRPSSTYTDYSSGGNYTNNSSVRSFIHYMVDKHGFSESYLDGLFAKAQRLDSVIRLESPAPDPRPPKPHSGSWTRYRNKFLTDDHINHGVEFWRENATTIQQASETYGVDPEYIVGIIGVETYFGRNIGKTCVFDALTTLSFDTHRRAKYFMSELENFLLMVRDEGYDPREPVGSWAGAMGLGQFMPSSFRKLAVDFDHNGRRDLWQAKDAIGSVAHYFSKNGWEYRSPVTQEVDDPSDSGVIELSTYDGSEYWRVHHNFKVIKRYNNSNKYAMAVYQLAQAIKQQR